MQKWNVTNWMFMVCQTLQSLCFFHIKYTLFFYLQAKKLNALKYDLTYFFGKKFSFLVFFELETQKNDGYWIECVLVVGMEWQKKCFVVQRWKNSEGRYDFLEFVTNSQLSFVGSKVETLQVNSEKFVSFVESLKFDS